MLKSYGFNRKESDHSELDFTLEQINYRGYAILEKCLDSNDISYAMKAIEEIYCRQEQSFGKSRLASINELDMVRAPLLEDRFFIEKMVMNPKVRNVVTRLIDGPHQLHLQNGIINRPFSSHHQSSWHRDLPYQNWTCSSVLAMSAFFCLCDFTAENGATWVLPYSHLFDEAPSDDYLLKNRVQMLAAAGSVVLFNSMVLHCAGSNVSQNIRVGINNIYTIPLIKQQIDFTDEFGAASSSLSTDERVILGLEYASPRSVEEWRSARLSKKAKI